MIPESELEGRMLDNAFGVPEKAILPKSNWQYFDWCVEQGADMVAWVKHIDELHKPELTFSENLWGCLWKDECNRRETGEINPPWPAPEGYEE